MAKQVGRTSGCWLRRRATREDNGERVEEEGVNVGTVNWRTSRRSNNFDSSESNANDRFSDPYLSSRNDRPSSLFLLFFFNLSRLPRNPRFHDPLLRGFYRASRHFSFSCVSLFFFWTKILFSRGWTFIKELWICSYWSDHVQNVSVRRIL